MITNHQLPNTTYYYTRPNNAPLYFCQYDENKEFIGSRTDGSGQTFTTLPNAKYVRFNCGSAYGATYNNDICINIHGVLNYYKPFKKYTYPLDSDVALRGIAKLDTNNSLYYYGDTYESDGVVTRNFTQYIFTGEETSTLANDTGTNYTWISIPLTGMKDVGEVYNSDFIGLGLPNYKDSLADESGMFHRNASLYISYNKGTYSNAAEFIATLTGKTIIYELEVPTIEAAEPFARFQHTFEQEVERFIDERDIPIPVGHYSKYHGVLNDKIDALPIAAEADGTYIIRQSEGQMQLDEYSVDEELNNNSTNPVQNNVITEALDAKANTNGVYDNLVAGNINSTQNYVSITPYFIKKSNNDKRIVYNEEKINSLIGGSIYWNQLIDNGNFRNNNSYNTNIKFGTC